MALNASVTYLGDLNGRPRKVGNLLTHLVNNEEKMQNTWRICHRKKAFDKRVVWDKQRKQALKIDIIYEPVWHPKHPDRPLSLIAVRHKTLKAQQPLYLLTNSQVDTIGIAWEIFHSYIQRSDIEQVFRFNKSELGIESIRLYEFENRLKMMALVTLIYDFLLQFWQHWKSAALMLINKWCPRSDKRFLKAHLPIYRFRAALFVLLLTLIAQYPRRGRYMKYPEFKML